VTCLTLINGLIISGHVDGTIRVSDPLSQTSISTVLNSKCSIITGVQQLNANQFVCTSHCGKVLIFDMRTLTLVDSIKSEQKHLFGVECDENQCYLFGSDGYEVFSK
jgi:hypothetical protein